MDTIIWNSIQIYIINNCIQGNQFSHLRNDQITKIKEIFNEK